MKKRKVIALVLLGLGILCGAVGIMKYIEEKNAGKEYEKLQQEVVKEEPKPVEEPEPEPVSKVEIPIDFAALTNSPFGSTCFCLPNLASPITSSKEVYDISSPFKVTTFPNLPS